MAQNVVIVESPKKIQTYKKVLGKDYDVLASRGHCVDLPEKSLSIDIKNGFEPTFEVKDDHKAEIVALKAAVKKAKHIYYMTDEDREGEAIAWHLHNLIKDVTKAEIHRATTNEITAKGIKKAIANPGQIDTNKIDAYLCRRLLDRLCGYKTSYLTFQATGGKSAGRVQSAILRILADREEEILSFKPKEYWVLTAYLLSLKGEPFTAILTEKIHVPNEQEAVKIYDSVIKASPLIDNVDIKDVNVNPSPPFTTIPMVGAASTIFGFTAKKTMSVAQKLYEGGHITYMRTDSPFMASEAVSAIRARIEHEMGSDYLPKSQKVYSSKKGAQEAHECCRPTNIDTQSISLGNDEQKLYELIWKRAISSQMSSGKDERTRIITKIAGYDFISNGNVVLFDGYRKVWSYSSSQSVVLPKLSKGDECTLKNLEKQQKFTQPPPRFSDASLGKTCEKEQITRPSTFAKSIDTLLNRGYIVQKKKTFHATELGRRVSQFLKGAGMCFVDVKFTAEMELLLDQIQGSVKNKKEVLSEFWERLKKDIESGKKLRLKNQETKHKCPKCGGMLLRKNSKFGQFYSCENYKPKEKGCSYIANVGKNDEPIEKVVKKKEYAKFPCKVCGAKMVKRSSKYGEFYGCEKFPSCRATADLEGTFKEAKKKSWKKWGKKKAEKHG